MNAFRLIGSYLFGEKDTYGDYLHGRIDAYERWRDEQVCDGCWERGVAAPKQPTEFDLRIA